ncbi:MAG: T9SS type A sorting domain-containing protein, partial [candidate division Zixibacteria bacterium]|nr:T9SS type A sorting domain-containing protein [candidate division Zixibacteria bacterium]
IVYDSVLTADDDTTLIVILGVEEYYWTVSTFTCSDTAFSESLYFRISPMVDVAEDEENIPKVYFLSQSYPNPFNPMATIPYGLPKASQVKLVVYDITGRFVKTLVDDYQSAGYKYVIWDGTNESGDNVATGIYFYNLHAGEFQKLKKMTLLK